MSEDYIQASLFRDVQHPDSKPLGRQRTRLKILITVKAAPNPSEQYGETVCVAGIGTDDVGTREWIRLYPINFRHLEQETLKFRKYDLIEVDCIPANTDQRRESWKPFMDTLKVLRHLGSGTKRRREFVDPVAGTDTMCGLFRAALENAEARSLGLVKPLRVKDLKIRPHRGWSVDEQRKIDAYISQEDLFTSAVKTPLEAPAYTGHYRWTCREPLCKSHETMILDWEFVALQRRLLREGYRDFEIRERLRTRFFEEMCASSRDVAFYVGNQAKRPQTFSILGIYWPRRD